MVNNMDKFEETYLNIIKEEAIPKAQLVDTKQHQCKVGPITQYYYENEIGRFQISYQPYGSDPPYKYVYTVCRVEINRFGKEADTSLHNFKTQEEAIAYGERRLVEFTQERQDYYNGLADWARRPRSGWYLD